MTKTIRRRSGTLLLALAACAALTLAGQINLLAVYSQASRLTGHTAPLPRFQASLAVMLIPGAFLSALPGRIRRRKEPRLHSTWQGCLSCFIGGVILLLAAGLAHGGDGLHLTGLLQGSISAYAFWAVAMVTGLIAALVRERRKT